MANVEKRGNTYKITVSMGYDLTGKKLRKSTTYTPPGNVTPGKALKLAHAFAADFEKKCQGATALNENMRFSELCEWYFDNYAPSKLKEVTIYNYQSTVKHHIAPTFGNVKLKDITTARLSEFFKTVPLAPGSQRKVYIILSSIMTCAVKQGFILQNPCKNAILPKAAPREAEYLTAEQAKALLSMLSEYSQFNTIVKLLIYTGMRAGECLALRWEDIDFENCIISIRHTLTEVERKRFLTVPKTKSSIRSIKVSQNIIDLLKVHRAEKVKDNLKLGELCEHSEMVFTDPLGRYLSRNNTNAQFKRIVKNTDFPNVSLHSLRHCNATLLINAGVPLKIVSEHLGHCDIGVTANIYAHILESSKAKAAEALDNALLD